MQCCYLILEAADLMVLCIHLNRVTLLHLVPEVEMFMYKVPNCHVVEMRIHAILFKISHSVKIFLDIAVLSNQLQLEFSQPR